MKEQKIYTVVAQNPSPSFHSYHFFVLDAKFCNNIPKIFDQNISHILSHFECVLNCCLFNVLVLDCKFHQKEEKAAEGRPVGTTHSSGCPLSKRPPLPPAPPRSLCPPLPPPIAAQDLSAAKSLPRNYPDPWKPFNEKQLVTIS